jgi:hypothetical protein
MCLTGAKKLSENTTGTCLTEMPFSAIQKTRLIRIQGFSLFLKFVGLLNVTL